MPPDLLHDFTDDEARRALPTKWGSVPSDVIPAWIAEMDYAVAPAIADALRDAVADSLTGYPAFEDGGRLGGAYADFARRHYGQSVDPDLLVPVVDVTAGVRLVLDVLCGPGPLVLQVPAYPPQLQVAQVTGRELVTVPLDPDSPIAPIDLDGIDRALAAGGQTVLLTQPHNPLGRCYSREELEGLRDVVTARGARVISDEIHAPLALPGATHTPYLTLPGTAEHAVALVSTSKAFNTPGLRCAQILSLDEATHQALVSVPMVRNDSWSPLGVVGAIAAYEHGDEWLAALIERLDAQRTLLGELLSEHLPEAKMRPLEATYVAWLDLRAYGHEDPADVMLRKGRVCLQTGSHFHPGLPGHARLNIATSPDRLSEIVRRMASALT